MILLGTGWSLKASLSKAELTSTVSLEKRSHHINALSVDRRAGTIRQISHRPQITVIMVTMEN